MRVHAAELICSTEVLGFRALYTAVSRKVVQQNRTRQYQKVLWVMGVSGP